MQSQQYKLIYEGIHWISYLSNVDILVRVRYLNSLNIMDVAGSIPNKEAITVPMYGYTWTLTQTWEYSSKGTKKYTARNTAFKACQASAKCAGVTQTVSNMTVVHYRPPQSKHNFVELARRWVTIWPISMVH